MARATAIELKRRAAWYSGYNRICKGGSTVAKDRSPKKEIKKPKKKK